jgi:hypothetical protein|tara:strand:- start:1379 stop:2056 length:678 start_codon:yes stop_codon:yes gene_type:complete
MASFNSTIVNQEWKNSFFIPHIDFSITKSHVKSYFETFLQVGTVSRVDFVSFNNEKGVGRRAFVHFDEYRDITLKTVIQSDGFYDIIMYGFQIRIMMNNNPVPPTQLNLDQVASNTEFLADDLQRIDNTLLEYQEWKDWSYTKLNNILDSQLQYDTSMNTRIQHQDKEIQGLKQQVQHMYKIVQQMETTIRRMSRVDDEYIPLTIDELSAFSEDAEDACVYSYFS